MYKGKKNFRQLKKNVMYIAKCYRTNIDRLLLDGYDNHKVDYVKQTHSDLEMVGYLNFVLELCSKESNLFLRAVYFDQNDNKLYFESLSRSSYYRKILERTRGFSADLKADTTFEELKMDDYEIVDFLMNVEECYRFAFHENEMLEMKTMQNVMDMINKNMQED